MRGTTLCALSDPLEGAIIDRCRRKGSSVEEALVEMNPAGVSVRRVEDITEALGGSRASSSTVCELNQRIYGRIEEWRASPIEGNIPMSTSTAFGSSERGAAR